MNTSLRFIGSILGLAIGDAIGTTNEFTTRQTATKVTGMVGGGPFHLPPGYWTDDTSMMLCLGHSLLEWEAFNPDDQIGRYIKWRDEGYMSSTGECFDIGSTCDRAMRYYQGNPDNPYPGSIITNKEDQSGNGSLMRLAPIPLVYYNSPDLFSKLALSSEVTHGARRCVDSCMVYGGIMAGILHGESKEVVLSPLYKSHNKWWSEHQLDDEVRIVSVGVGSYKSLPEADVRTSGYVIHSMEAALWAFYHTTNFKDGVLLCANWGDDSDTVAAIYGQLAGAYYGTTGIPPEWIDQVFNNNELIKMGNDLYKLNQLLHHSQV